MTDLSYSAACDGVVEAFLEAFPDRLRSRTAELASGLDLEEAQRQGMQWLTAELRQWAQLPAVEQRQGPLHILQTAYAFPTAALEAAGIPPVTRDIGAEKALPGDVYALAPVSSRDLGEAAWRAHVAWGVSKAKLVANVEPNSPPTESLAIAAVTMNQADRAAIHLVATGRGIPARHWRNPGAIAAGLEEEIPRWAVVDLDHGASDEAVRMLADAGCKVAVYGPDPDDIAMARWMSIGAATVVPHDRLVAVIESWLPLQA